MEVPLKLLVPKLEVWDADTTELSGAQMSAGKIKTMTTGTLSAKAGRGANAAKLPKKLGVQ